MTRPKRFVILTSLSEIILLKILVHFLQLLCRGFSDKDIITKYKSRKVYVFYYRPFLLLSILVDKQYLTALSLFIWHSIY